MRTKVNKSVINARIAKNAKNKISKKFKNCTKVQ